MVNVQYRTARPEDISEMVDLYLLSLTDMHKRFNIPMSAPPKSAMLIMYGHILSTGIFHVAEQNGRIVAIAGAILRDHLWFLSQFWAKPEIQRKNIGMPLLRRVWNVGKEMGATIFFTWASIDPTAIASYMKLGMLPGYPILVFEGEPTQIPALPVDYQAAELNPTENMALDRIVRGTQRKPEHAFWLGLMGKEGRKVFCKGENAGYYYFANGTIGPVAWEESKDAVAVMTLAFREATAITPKVQMFIPGINHAALQFALASGLRLMGFAHFLTTSPFGHMEHYMPSGPALY
jgi:hypothetical protein